ncbi:hypothetical protein [Roseimaritima ulvae]|uniref:Uncharacterized protein n=1 Tax=Roseimaritima ulvae TaxID=980254 RepID=A0A5B9QKM5_9BACT|nr:hypothetical protein [Roseimaritima ulvae]QEG39444.1 hypothetical protein UC8_14390 [Roseimaritima ulvae]
METLAQHLVDLADQQAVSPVVMAQPGLRLRALFYVALAETLLQIAQRDVQLELVTELQGWTSGVQRLALRRLTNRLNALLPDRAVATQVAVVGRPAGTQRALVIGVACSDLQLPPWAEAVRVCTRPTQTTDFQLTVA